MRHVSPMLVLVAGTFGLGTGLLPHAVSAQTPAPDRQVQEDGALERGQFVRDRRRPEIDPLGVRLGSFFLFPQSQAGVTYDDNIFATQRNTESDLIYTVEPQLALRSNFGRHDLRLTAAAEAGRYQENTSENYFDYLFDASGRYDFGNRAALRGGFIHRREHEERDDPDSNRFAPREPIVFHDTGGTVGFNQPFGRFNLDLGAGAQFTAFDDAVGGTVRDQSFRDRWTYDGTARIGYEIQPGYEAFLRGTYTVVDYEKRDPGTGIRRDSTGYELVAGARLDLTGLIAAQVFAGYLTRNYDDSRLSDFDGLAFGGRLDWAVTQLTTIYGEAARQVVETSSFNSSSIDRRRFTVGADHELLRQFILNAEIGYVDDKFNGASVEDTYWRFTFGGTYTFNRNLFVNAGYTYRQRDSDTPNRDFDNNLVRVRLGVRL